MKRDWENITATSDYATLEEIKKAFKENDMEEVEIGLEELSDLMAKHERRALLSQLIRLMMHIIKWQIQPEKRSGSRAL